MSRRPAVVARRPVVAVRPASSLRLSITLFAVSGFAAALYQVSWQRLLTFSTGGTTGAVALSVAGFLGGLGVGGLLGGRLSLNFSRRRAWLGFCLCEALIAAYAWGSSTLLVEWLPTTSGADVALARALAGLAIFLPAVPMGATLPLLVRSAALDAASLARPIGLLYGINALGSCLGAALTPWVLFPRYGIGGTIEIAAALSTLTAVAAALRWEFSPQSLDESPQVAKSQVAKSHGEATDGPQHTFAWWPLLAAWSGLIAVGLEIIWFRIVDVVVKSTSLSFGSMLAVYLAGLALGSFIAARGSVRFGEPLRAFLVAQTTAVATAALALLLLTRTPVNVAGYASLVEYWRSYEGYASVSYDQLSAPARYYFGFSAALFFVPTVCFGAAFVFLQRAVQDDVRSSGWKIGVAQAAGIAGNVAGSYLVGFVGFPLLGTATSLQLLLLLGATFPLAGIWLLGRMKNGLLGCGLLVLLVALLPDQDAFWKRLHGEPAEFVHDEDADGVMAVVPRTEGPVPGEQWLVLNGKGISWFPYGGVHTQLGALPAFLHPAPRRAAVIGLGSGDSTWGVSRRRELEQIDVFEICLGMDRLLRRTAERPEQEPLRQLLADPRIRLHHDDGRRALAAGGEPYDLIEIDALRPQSPAAGNLYSVEFYRLCAARLAPQGLLCQWSPTLRTTRSFQAALPHVLYFPDGPILIGSPTAISYDVPTLQRRLNASAAPPELAKSLLAVAARGMPITPQQVPPGTLNEDLFPRDEFFVGEE